MKRIPWVLGPIAAVVACSSESSGPSTAAPARWVDEPSTASSFDAGASGACPPSALAPEQFRAARKPARERTQSCAAGETTEVLNACDFEEASCIRNELVPCYACLYSRETDATLSYRIISGGGSRVNLRGYLLRTGVAEACANAVGDYQSCLVVACSCAKTSGAKCQETAKRGACSEAGAAITASCPASAEVTEIRSLIDNDSLGSKATVLRLAKAFCGGS